MILPLKPAPRIGENGTPSAPVSETVIVDRRLKEPTALDTPAPTLGSGAPSALTAGLLISPEGGVLSDDATEGASGKSDGHLRILVVDDDADSAEALAVSLVGYDVTVITDPAEALSLIVGGASYHVIVSDIMMPGMSGDVLYAKLLVLAPEQAERMIFVTGGGTTAETRAFISTMSGRVVGKPVDLTVLAKRVEERLAPRIPRD